MSPRWSSAGEMLPPDASAASMCDKPVPLSSRSFETRSNLALSQLAICFSSSPSGAKLTWPPSVSTTFQPRAALPVSSATPRPVPVPSTVTGPLNGASCAPCKVTTSAGSSAGTAQATAPKSFSTSSESRPRLFCNSARLNAPGAIGQPDLVAAARRCHRDRRACGLLADALEVVLRCMLETREFGARQRSLLRQRRRLALQVGQGKARIGAADVGDHREICAARSRGHCAGGAATKRIAWPPPGARANSQTSPCVACRVSITIEWALVFQSASSASR